MTIIECQGCGRRLELPADLPEGGELVCARCGLLLRNVEAARAFRWAEVDPFVRRRGASRTNLWGGALGSSAWLLVLVGLAVAGRVPASLVVVLGAPYLAGVALLFRLRARAPAAAWLGGVWIFLGLYLVYAWLVVRAWPGWGGVLLGSGPGFAPASLLVFGLGAALSGLVTILWYRLRSGRTPRLDGRPPDEDDR